MMPSTPQIHTRKKKQISVNPEKHVMCARAEWHLKMPSCCRARWPPLTLRSRSGIFRMAAPQWFPKNFRNFRKRKKPTAIWPTFSAIYCFIYKLKHMVLDFSQTPPTKPPSPATLLPFYRTDLQLQDFQSHHLPLCFIPSSSSSYLHLYHPLRESSVVPPELPVLCTIHPWYHCPCCTTPPPTAPSPSKPQDRLLSSCVRRCLAPLGPLRACVHLKRFTETHICCFRAQRDFRRGRGPFEVASRGEPEPERAASSQEP